MLGVPARAAIVLVTLTAAARIAAVEEVVGTASVIDGDTLEIHGKKIRLHGVDAPESRQQCEANGAEWRCGQQAALALSDKIGRWTVTCKGKKRDRYGRLIAVCSVGGEEINRWLVQEGWALAFREYSKDYVPDEEVAKMWGRGIWKGKFVEPWEWRKKR